jgi:hypothetical protein
VRSRRGGRDTPRAAAAHLKVPELSSAQSARQSWQNTSATRFPRLVSEVRTLVKRPSRGAALWPTTAVMRLPMAAVLSSTTWGGGGRGGGPCQLLAW